MTQTRESFNDYGGFVEKFKPKKTTDDCYTPTEIYDVVRRYVNRRWGVTDADIVRPFWPGGDYENHDYPDGCCVVDNPPFSMLAKIESFYLDRGIRFFLFAPSLTCLSGTRCMEIDHIVCNANIAYENSAVVLTAFVTNLDTEHVLEADPELGDAINAANAARLAKTKKQLPKYDYPDCVITAARAQFLASHGTPLMVRRSDALHISALDAQRGRGKAIFGSGLLLGERAAAERAAAERAAACKWQLSEREREMQAALG